MGINVELNIRGNESSKSDLNALEKYLQVVNTAWIGMTVDRPKVPIVDRVIYSGSKTIVLWKDGTKTIVGCSEGETYDEFDGFTAALAKKIYGSTCAVKREIRKKSSNRSTD